VDGAEKLIPEAQNRIFTGKNPLPEDEEAGSHAVER
jgi:hypothetical protein